MSTSPSDWDPSAGPGYGPAGPTSDEKTWAMLTHLSIFVIGLIGPLIVLLTKGKDSGFVRANAVSALNFHLSLLIYTVVAAILVVVLIGLLLLLALGVAAVVFAILATVAANRGETYRYPLTIPLVK